MTKLFAALIAGAALAWPSHSWADCTYADGTAAPEPGLSQEALDSEDWAPTFVRLLSRLNEGDRSTLVAILIADNAALVTNKCSNNDLLWTHLSLVGISEEDPDSVPVGLPEDVAGTIRAFTLTDHGRDTLPGLLQTVAGPN